MIDWPALLSSHGIEFVESGPSTAKGNIYVFCPWGCDKEDQKTLGISLKGRGFGCWKNQQHRGKSARRLLGGLLGIGISQAQALLDNLSGGSLGGLDAMQQRIKTMRGEDQGILEEDRKLDFPDEIKPITPKGQGRLFISYFAERGWPTDHAMRAIFRYKMRYAMKGAFAYRLVIPIYGPSKELLTWTGRTIAPDIEPRYKTLSTDAEKAREDDLPIARANIKHCLFSEDEIMTKMGRGLIVCEGPLDAIRIDYVGSRLGIKGTCLFGKTISDEQVDKLAEVAPYYGRKLFLLDADATIDSYRVVERVKGYGYKVARLPPGYKDPGEMPLSKIEDFLERVL